MLPVTGSVWNGFVCAAAGVAPEFGIGLHSCSSLSQDQLERIAGQTPRFLELQTKSQLEWKKLNNLQGAVECSELTSSFLK